LKLGSAHPPRPMNEITTMETRTLMLAKGGHHYIFRYLAGMEDEIVEEIMRLAESRACDLDWLDAATLSFQVAQYAADCHETSIPTGRKN